MIRLIDCFTLGFSLLKQRVFNREQETITGIIKKALDSLISREIKPNTEGIIYVQIIVSVYIYIYIYI